MEQTTKTPRRGRPPAGPDGARVGDLPRITLRLEPATKALLLGAAEVTKRPAWRIVQDALAAHFADLPTKERRRAVALGEALAADGPAATRK